MVKKLILLLVQLSQFLHTLKVNSSYVFSQRWVLDYFKCMRLRNDSEILKCDSGWLEAYVWLLNLIGFCSPDS